MKTGKLTPQELEEIVLSKLPALSPAVSCGPGNGLDCAAVRISPEHQIIISSDPITGADSDIGSIAIHVSCNDLAAFGVKPEAITLVLLVPVAANKSQIEKIMEQASLTAQKLKVDIVGGHTEVSEAVNRFVIITTALGVRQGPLIQSGGSRAGDTIIMTKSAALEGTAILAADCTAKLDGLIDREELDAARNMINQISVVEEGIIAGKSGLVHAMHDATEGGILGAAWEMAESAGLGVNIFPEKIPIHEITGKICSILNIDPFKLISSGSMLMSTDKPEQVIRLLNRYNIEAAAIGEMTAGPARLLISGGSEMILEPPQQDELYKYI